MEPLRNAYADPARAESYARLEFPATYWLAYRDLPALLAAHVSGRRALDFGCGAGRSSRFLRDLGYHAVGVDISAAMIQAARQRDPQGSYRLIAEDDLSDFPEGAFDLVLCAYPFDNIPGEARRVRLLSTLRTLLDTDGRLVLLASTPEIYTHEWVTFTTAAFPENARATSGERVRIVIREGGDDRPIDDLIWFDDDYRRSFRRAGLEILATHRPLGREDEPYPWISETRVAPWVVYVTGPA
jgi:SAM-dependent methyltransferase